MDRVSIAEVDRTPADRAVGRRCLTDHLNTRDVAINHYRVDPGDGLPGGLHAHADQEEVFVVLDGEAIFETLDGEIAAAAGEAIRFAPGEFHSGRNAGDDDLVVLALGAPRDTDDVRIPFACPDCGHDDLRFDVADGTFVCPDCGVEHAPSACPDCGAEDLEATLGEAGAPVVVCGECAATYDRPPLRE